MHGLQETHLSPSNMSHGVRAHPQGVKFKRAFVASFTVSAPAERSVGNCSPAKKMSHFPPSTITAGEAILWPVLGILESFSNV